MTSIDSAEAVRTRLASRKSFFGGALYTGDRCKAVSWRDLPSVKARSQGASEAAQTAPSSEGKLAADCTTRAKKRDVNRDFSDLRITNAAGPAATAALLRRTPPEHSRQPTAVSVAQHAPQLRSKSPLTKLNIPLGKEAALPPSSAGIGRQRKAEGALRARVDAAIAEHRAMKDANGPSACAPQSPSQRQTKSRQAVLTRHQQQTSLGLQTVLLLRRPTPASKAAGTPGSPASGPAAASTAARNLSGASQSPGTGSARAHARPGSAERGRSPSAPRPVRMRMHGTFYGSAQPMPARRKVRTVDDESCSDLDSFIEEDGDEHGGDSEWAGDDSGPGGGDGVQGWREALKETLGGYDASKFAEVDRLPDRRMHASFAEIAAEEAKAARIAREVDRVEAERDAAEREERRRRREEEGYGGSESGSESESDSESESEGDSNGRPRKRRRRCAFVAR